MTISSSSEVERPYLSVVIPFWDEEGSLEELYRRLTDALKEVKGGYELLFVDDGSRDRSRAIVESLQREDSRVRLFSFRRNQGKSAALALGFEKARGEYVATIDADLQDDPYEIPHLLQTMQDKGWDLISGWKKVRHDPWSKKLPSRLFNRVTALLTGIPLHDFNCGLKCYRSEVLKEIELFGERHRFIPVLAHFAGFKVGELPVRHHPRRFGRSKFGWYRFLAGFFDLITLLFRARFMSKPLHLFGSIGLISLLAGLGILIYLGIGWLGGRWIGNRPIFIIGVMAVIAGVQLFTLGLLGEMIAEIKQEKRFPLRKEENRQSGEH